MNGRVLAITRGGPAMCSAGLPAVIEMYGRVHSSVVSRT